MLTYALTMTFVCGMVFGVLLILCVAELIRRHDNKKAIENSSFSKDSEMPFNMQEYLPA